MSVSQFARIGIKVDAAELVAENTLEIKLTPAQFSKLDALMPVKLLTIRDNRAICEVAESDLESAIASNAKAPRGSGASCTIDTETVYAVKCDDKAVNNVTAARWNSANGTGTITVNKLKLNVGVGKAEDFYEIGEESNPERPVFVVTAVTAENELTLTSYGMTNLIRRVVAVSEVIIG